MTLDYVYYVIGIFLLIFTTYTLFDGKQKHKWGTAAFWFLYGVSFIWGASIPPVVVGVMVVVMALIAGCKKIGMGSYNEVTADIRHFMAEKHGNWIFGPVLVIPVITFLIAKYTKMGALVGFGIGAIIAYGFAVLLTRVKPAQSFNEGRRLMDAIGWAAILSQFLAALGFLFDKSGVGKIIATMVSSIVPVESLLATVVAYCIGMALFTMIMGNAFAAFAVITTGIGLPLVINIHGGNPAIVGVIGMLAGYCGTLITPMAANFNVVPAALLEMKDKNGVIKAQACVAILMLIVNIILMYILAF